MINDAKTILLLTIAVEQLDYMCNNRIVTPLSFIQHIKRAPEGTGVGACQNELWINPSVFTISEGNYVMKPAEDVDECPRTYDMIEFAGF